MKKQFTPELIKSLNSAFVEITHEIKNNLLVSDEQKLKNHFEKDIDGVILAVTINDRKPLEPNQHKTLTIKYGNMIIATNMSLGHLGPLQQFLAPTLGERLLKYNEHSILKMIKEDVGNKRIIATLNGDTFSYDFSIELPGDVVFSRIKEKLSIEKNKEMVYLVMANNAQVVENHINVAVHIATTVCEPEVQDARVVDLNKKTIIGNGGLYLLQDDGKIALYFPEDQHTSVNNSGMREAVSHPYHGGMMNTPMSNTLCPNQQFYPNHW